MQMRQPLPICNKKDAADTAEDPSVRSVSVSYAGLFSRNSTCRAGTFTCTAVQTCISVDYVLSISFRDSVCRTFLCACSACYTFIRNYICHDSILLLKYGFWYPFGTFHLF